MANRICTNHICQPSWANHSWAKRLDEHKKRMAEDQARRAEKEKRKAANIAESEERARAKRARQAQGGGAGTGRPNTESAMDRMRRKPQKVPKTCSFYNIGTCKNGSNCRFQHVCWECGGNHTWLSTHA